MKACVFTLGCKLNESESASLMRGLEEMGYEVTDAPGAADLYLLNTCAVTAEAERKSRQAVARMRKFNPAAPVIVFGCAAEHDAEAFAAREGVTFVAGAMRKDKILSMLQERGVCIEREEAFCELPMPKMARTRAFLRVQDGCNRFCSYCLIPYLRGRSRSRAAASVLAEARACTAKEIVLTGVDLSSYRDGDVGLDGLVLALKDVPARIRLGSLEVSAVTDALLSAMRAAGTAPHFHLSLQSGSTKVLRAMNRHYTREEYLSACRKIYAAFPGAAITTDIIVGFPSETEEDFAESLSIVEEAGFSKVHAFPFSPRKGTNAARLEDIPPAVKSMRMDRMLEAAAAAEKRYIENNLGKTFTALFEEDGGYTENYIRVYNKTASEGGMYEVRLLKRCEGGAECELLSRVE